MEELLTFIFMIPVIIVAIFSVIIAMLPFIFFASPFILIYIIVNYKPEKKEVFSTGAVLRDGKGNVVRNVARYYGNPNGNYKG